MDKTLTVLGVVEKDPGARNGDPGADDTLFRLQVDFLGAAQHFHKPG